MPDLVTLAEVRSALEYAPSDTSRDNTISGLIPQASLAIAEATGREFTPMGTLTRSYETPRGYPLRFDKHDLRSASTVTVNGTAATAGTDYALSPVNPDGDVYSAIRFSETFNPAVTDYERAFGVMQVDVAGDWGWQATPANIKRAAIVTIASWLSAEYSAVGFTGLDDPRQMAPPIPRQWAIPTAAWSLLLPYVRHGIA